MNDFLINLRDEFLNVWRSMNVTQRVLLSLTSLAIVVGFIVLMLWIQQPHYVVLFSNLSPETAGDIVTRLKDSNVKYRLSNSGTTIEVPNKQVYDLRIELARDGLPGKGETGYELFDTNKLGMSDFMQKISYRRALEGELMRTIQQMEEIEFARLHIVIPEPSLFEEDKNEPTASIVLKLRPNSDLGTRQIRGISYLVASSVEGLKAENVTIVDNYGNILSDQLKHDSIVGLSASQLEMKKKVDSYLANKVQTLFDRVLGSGNSVVRVDADLNFKQVNKTSESYDPENTTVRSEEIVSESNPVDTNQTGTVEHTTTNYEINHTVENVLESSGNIKRLSIGILVNGVRTTSENEKGEEEVTFTPRSQEELDQLANIAKNAVGFYAERNDQITITHFNFDTSQLSREVEELKKYEHQEMIRSIIRKAVLGVVVLVFLLYVRSIVRKVVKRVPKEPEQPELDVEHIVETAEKAEIEEKDMLEDMYTEESPEAKIAKQQHEKILDFAKNQPEEMSRLIRTWIEEDNTV